MAQLVGKVWRKNAEVILVFKVNGKYYPANDDNVAIFENYLKYGNEAVLDKLDKELEV